MPDTVNTPHVKSLTHETAVEHPGSHQHEGEQKEDEVVMVPCTWKTTNVSNDSKVCALLMELIL